MARAPLPVNCPALPFPTAVHRRIGRDAPSTRVRLHPQIRPRKFFGGAAIVKSSASAFSTDSQFRDLEDGVIAGQPDPSPVGDLDGMAAGERSKRREREDALIEVEAAIGQAIPGRAPQLDAGMDVAGDDKADPGGLCLILLGLVLLGGRRSGDVDKPQRRLVKRGNAGIEAELVGEPPRRDVVIAQHEHHRRRRHPIAKGAKLRHDVARAATRGVEQIAENEHPGHGMVADESLEAGEIALRRALGDRNPGPAKRGRLAEMEIGDEKRPRRGDKRPSAREEKNVGRDHRASRSSGNPRKVAGGRAPGSGDDGKRRRHAVWSQRSINAEGMRPTVAVAGQPGQRPGTGPGRR